MKKKILVVDDEPELLEFMAKFLTEKGYHVATASDGLEAFLMILVNDYNVVITNIKMPIINGLELLRMVKGIKKDLKIIMHTACHDFEKEAKESGAFAFFKKPVTIDKLLVFLGSNV